MHRNGRKKYHQNAHSNCVPGLFYVRARKWRPDRTTKKKMVSNMALYRNRVIVSGLCLLHTFIFFYFSSLWLPIIEMWNVTCFDLMQFHFNNKINYFLFQIKLYTFNLRCAHACRNSSNHQFQMDDIDQSNWYQKQITASTTTINKIFFFASLNYGIL